MASSEPQCLRPSAASGRSRGCAGAKGSPACEAGPAGPPGRSPRSRQADAGRRPRPGQALPPGYPTGSLLRTAPGPAPPFRTSAYSDRAPLAPVSRPRPSRPRRHPGAPHGSAPWPPRSAPRAPGVPAVPATRVPLRPGDRPATRLDRPAPPEYPARPVLLIPVNCPARVRRYAPVRRRPARRGPFPGRGSWPRAASGPPAEPGPPGKLSEPGAVAGSRRRPRRCLPCAPETPAAYQPGACGNERVDGCGRTALAACTRSPALLP